MGLYFRKSKNFGPFRLNFSKSGIGVSTGIKGARVSVGPRGTFFNAGSNGIYYRKKIGSNSRKKVDRNSNKIIKQSINNEPANRKENNKKGIKLIITAIAISVIAFAIFKYFKIEIDKKEIDIIVLSIFTIASGSIIGGIGYLRNNFSYKAIGICQILIGLFTIVLGNSYILFIKDSMYKEFTYISAGVLFLTVLITFIVITQKHNSINIVSNELDRMTYDIQFANRLNVVFLVCMYISYVSIVFSIIISNQEITKYSIYVLAGIFLIYVFYLIFGTVKNEYEINDEQLSKWNQFISSFEAMYDSDKVYAMCSSKFYHDEIYKHPIKHFKTINEKHRNYIHSSFNCKSIQFSADGIKCLLLPDRIIAIDLFNAESFYYADIMVTKDVEYIEGHSSEIGKDRIFLSYEHLYKNKDGSADRRRSYNPLSFTFDMQNIQISDDNFWLKISASKNGLIDLIYPNIHTYFAYAKNNVVKETSDMNITNSEDNNDKESNIDIGANSDVNNDKMENKEKNTNVLMNDLANNTKIKDKDNE